jgi:hypothetical protein
LLSAALVVILACGGLPTAAADEPVAEPDTDESAAAPSGGLMSGKVRWGQGADGGPLVGARVIAFHVDEQKMYTSEPVGRNGHYELRGIPRGFYDIAVEVGPDIYVASEVAHIPPGAKLRLDFDLAPYPGGVAPSDRGTFQGTGAAGSGLANTHRKPRGREFWFSPKGLVIMSGIGGAALLGIALSSSDNETSASPSTP